MLNLIHPNPGVNNVDKKKTWIHTTKESIELYKFEFELDEDTCILMWLIMVLLLLKVFNEISLYNHI